MKISDYLKKLKKINLAIFLRFIGIFLTFLVSIIVARNYGAEVSGTFFYSLTLANSISVVSRLGLENIGMKFSSMGWSQKSAKKLSTMYLLYFIFIGFIIYFVTSKFYYLADNNFVDFSITERNLYYIIITSIAISVISYCVETTKGFGFPILALVIAHIITPLSFCIIIYLNMGFFNENLMYPYSLISIITALLAVLFLFNSITKTIKNNNSAMQFKFKSMIDFWFNSVIQRALIPTLPFVLLGLNASSIDVGLYAIAIRISGSVGLILYSINSVAIKSYGDSLRLSNIHKLGSLIQTNTAFSFLLTFPIFFIIFTFAEPLLAVFGDEFIKAKSILYILAVGQFVNMLSGPIGTVLIIADGEKILRNGAILSLIILLVGYFFIPVENPLLRICIAQSIGLIFVNIYNSYQMYKRFSIISIFGRV